MQFYQSESVEPKTFLFLSSFQANLLLMNSKGSTLTFLDKINISKSSNPFTNVGTQLNFSNSPQIFSISSFDHLWYERGILMVNAVVQTIFVYLGKSKILILFFVGPDKLYFLAHVTRSFVNALFIVNFSNFKDLHFNHH